MKDQFGEWVVFTLDQFGKVLIFDLKKILCFGFYYFIYIKVPIARLRRAYLAHRTVPYGTLPVQNN